MKERLSLCLNENFHSPLTLLAALPKDSNGNKFRLLRFFLSELRQIRWKYGPVQLSKLDIAGITIPYDASEYDPIVSGTLCGLIDWLIITESYDCIALPEIRRICSDKWDCIGYGEFIRHFILHIFTTACLTVLICIQNGNTYFIGSQRFPIDVGSTCLYPITAIIMAYIFAWDSVRLLPWLSAIHRRIYHLLDRLRKWIASGLCFTPNEKKGKLYGIDHEAFPGARGTFVMYECGYLDMIGVLGVIW